MYKTLLKIAAILSLLAATTLGQETPQVQVKAELQPQSSQEVDLVVRAKIAPGLHIYAQTQPKPFLATKFTVKSNPAIESVGEFVANKAPLMLRHESLGAELHEHETRWNGDLEFGSQVNLQTPTWSSKAACSHRLVKQIDVSRRRRTRSRRRLRFPPHHPAHC